MKFLPLCIVLLILAACSSAPSTSSTDFPAGDAGRGAELFTQQINGAPACSTCHTLDGTTSVGPSMQGYAERAPTRVENQSAQDYTYSSITQPAAYIVDGFSNTMYAQYGRQLSSQQIADVIAYLLTL